MKYEILNVQCVRKKIACITPVHSLHYIRSDVKRLISYDINLKTKKKDLSDPVYYCVQRPSNVPVMRENEYATYSVVVNSIHFQRDTNAVKRHCIEYARRQNV